MSFLQIFYRNVFVKLGLFSLIVVIPSIRFFFKIDLVVLTPLYLLLAYSIFFNLHRIIGLRVSRGMWWLAFIILVAAAVYFIYPVLSLRRNPGSTGDDSIILAAQSLLGGGRLYDVEISAKEPISPGPAWIILNAPFVLLHIYWLFGVTYVTFAIGLLRKLSNAAFTNIFCILTILSMVFAELLFNGHDLLPLSMALFSVNLLITSYLRKNVNPYFLILISVFLGVISSSRIVFGFLPIMYFLLLKNYHVRNSYILFGISSVVYVFVNLYFFLINDYFQPAHLIYKGVELLGLPFILIAIAVAIGGIFYLSSRLNLSKIPWNWTVLLVLSCLLIPLAYADLIKSGFNFRYWEGANYLVIPLPFLTYTLLADVFAADLVERG